MNKQDYMITQAAITLMGDFVGGLDLSEMIVMMQRAETVTPFSDPTLYREAGDALAKMIAMVQKLSEFRRAYREWSKVARNHECFGFEEAAAMMGMIPQRLGKE